MLYRKNSYVHSTSNILHILKQVKGVVAMEYKKTVYQNDENWNIKLFRPVLTEQQRSKRMEKVKKATMELLRENLTKGNYIND